MTSTSERNPLIVNDICKVNKERKKSEERVGTPDKVKRNRYAVGGYISGLLKPLCVVSSVNAVQALGKTVPGFQLNVFRFAFVFLVTLPLVLISRLDVRIQRGHLGYLAIVATFYTISSFTYYEMAKYFNSGTVGCITPALLLTFTASASVVVEKQLCRLHIMIAIILCLTGSLLYLQPEVFFGANEQIVSHPLCGDIPPDSLWSNSSREKIHLPYGGQAKADNISLSATMVSDHVIAETSDLFTGCMLALLQASSITVVVMVTSKKLSEVSPLVVCFWLGPVTTLTSLIAMFSFETPTFPTETVCVTMIAVHALTAAGSQILQMVTITLLEPVIFSLLDTLSTVLLCISQYTIMQDIYPARGNALEIVGAAIVVVGIALGPLFRMHEKVTEKDVTGDTHTKKDPKVAE